jgi:outer membrane protein OmpA-like peptidoglycan-associated protein
MRITELRDAANKVGRRLRVTVTGHTTEIGTEDFNMKLSRNRADRVVSQLALDGVDATALVPVGYAAAEQKFRRTSEDDAKNRRVTFTASFDESVPTP